MSRLLRFSVLLLVLAGLTGCCIAPPFWGHGGRYYDEGRYGHYGRDSGDAYRGYGHRDYDRH
jgi:hypothetical protein